ncbi:sensory box protein [Clostridium argentinense CDC 2741]|uniref:Sensory box protein n=1 Tax=Clostridium argentinense CDC 2741 TaxID=1418104 RepID=A0A0C1R3I4_9CLOT|nr:sigma-54-dependent Fis family transcriptional regulator [Clostridium argentinense]ARC83940.1 sigma-54-dependent Fis family transcriptional regulator [Clostridium argentinense]KIE45016.1 sensory box protein [Clostridium argentinense CDC 2741]NFF41220.1 sigma-54-dependent Fis family transcriptional regulator [Clostridium argentinense]NFP51664.1 sigma-54-dependent Fis family transcriptional regulator [Clostridium argentinense]NFP73933.1 sigma-54-dependent Fis family transcriptional regulator [
MNIGELLYKVKDIMNIEFKEVLHSDTVKQVSDMMITQNLDEVIVVDEKKKLMGIFTRKDLSKISTERKDLLEDKVINYAIKDVVTINPHKFARDARDIMISNNIGRLPVMEKDKIIGIITNNNLRDSFYLKVDEIFNLQNNILDNIHEAVCICDINGIVTYWNKSSEKLYKVKAKDIVGLKVTEHFNNPLIPKVLKEGKAIENIRHEPMRGKSVILSVIPIYNPKKEMVAVVSTDRDVTEVVSLSRRLESANAKVEMLSNAYNKEIANNYSFSYIGGKSKKIIEAINLCQKVAPSSASVLITGESGTGKEVFAKAIHEASGRNGQFVAINCSAIPENLLESELFGYVEGAFTGATKQGRMGMFEFANNGTLFLDEIGDMPLGMQSKLLRVLQDGVIYKLGSGKPVYTNTRIIAATNKDLKKSIKEETFRNDLFYRLAIVQVELPPLRERKEDIKDLINLFISQVSKNERIEIKKIDNRIYNILSSYKWEGNIRELKNVIQRMVLLSNGDCISVDSIPKYILSYEEEKYFINKDIDLEDKYNLEKMVKTLECEIIREVMNIAGGNKVKAAEILKIKRSTLYYKLKQYNMLDTCQ